MAESADRRDGRGRLSSIDLLPEEAQDDIVWAVARLNERDRSQADILFELNDRLAAKGLPAISRSAFNRRSMKLAAMSSRLAEARAIFEGVAPQFTAEKVDEQTVVLGEFIKLLIFEIVQSEGSAIGTKGAMELANAHLAVIRSQAVSAERRRKLEAEFRASAAKAVETAAGATGLTGATVDRIKAEILGIRGGP